MNSRETIHAWQGETVRLNVGGTVFETTLPTLRRFPGTLFEDIFEEESLKQLITRPDGTLFLDRSPEHFNYILNWLRNPEKKFHMPADQLG